MSIVPFAPPNEGAVLVAGAGGGYDFLCGLPIIIELEKRGREVLIANYSFSNLTAIKKAKWHRESLLEINADSVLEGSDYFPESFLSKWYRSRNVEKPIWCFPRVGVTPILDAYNYLIDKFNITTVFCVDGGVDGIFRGDEYDLGTPSMDSISVIAVSMSKAPLSIYVCTAFGTEGAEGKVSHAQALNRMADLIREGALLGVSIINGSDTTGQDFSHAVRYIFSQTDPIRRSVIISTLMASIEGNYGRISVHPKTEERKPWISPLTSLVWYFQAKHVAKMKYFYEKSKNTRSVTEVAEAIEGIRKERPIEPYEDIPI
ncbi:MAG: DUF1152 domain-containing protein [Desulfobacterales bacterium]